MKNTLLKIGLGLVITLGLGCQSAFALSMNDSMDIANIKKEMTQLNKKLNELNKPIKTDTTAAPCNQYSVYNNIPSRGERRLVSMLIISPIVLVGIALIWLIAFIRKNKELFSNLFVEKNGETIKTYTALQEKRSAALQAKVVPADGGKQVEDNLTPPDPELPRSSSRVIMFLSGIVALLLASVIVSFYIYSTLRCNKEPDLNSLLYILLALGVGVIPYAVNKVKG